MKSWEKWVTRLSIPFGIATVIWASIHVMKYTPIWKWISVATISIFTLFSVILWFASLMS